MVRWAVAVGVAVLVGVGLWAFEPWRLVTSSVVDEPLPSSAPSSRTSDPAPAKQPAKESAAPTDRELSRGRFEDGEHDTGGDAVVLELADGRRFVRLEDLATSDGPDLHVWVTDQPSGGEWGSYDDGRYVGLGELKATNGNQNYEVPDGTDLAGLRSVVIWCDRFNVAFGTAPIRS